MYDIFFISFDEPNADLNWERLVGRLPLAQRVHGVKGILNAHKECAKKSATRMFFVVDGDSEVLNSFDFSFVPPVEQQEFTHVWRARNPVNQLIYGYGGIKLLPVSVVLQMPEMATDMTTALSENFVVHQTLASITRFNSSPFNAWRAAFRECVKLSSKIIDRQNDQETEHRLWTWQNIGRKQEFGEYVIEGAKSGAIYGKQWALDGERLSLINNFEWLHEQFDKTFG